MTYGYVVIDTETTGLYPNNNRIIEMAAVGLRADGTIEGEWSTLLNPDRDLGRTDIHQITAHDILDAPHFTDIAGDLAEVLRGRVIVGHNVRFDVGFVESEYHRAGHAQTFIPHNACVCTMHLSGQVLPVANRTLETCCHQVGVINNAAHCALSDARATAALFQRLVPRYGGFEVFGSRLGVTQRLAAITLPPLTFRGVACVRRGQPSARDVHFLGRLAAELPPITGLAAHNDYLALLDRVLIDRLLSAREADEIVRLAADLGIDRTTASRLNREYLVALARAALADGRVDESEYRDLATVAGLLGLDEEAIRPAIDQAWRGMQQNTSAVSPASTSSVSASMFRLAKGDMVVFTGEMSRPRDELEQIATRVGLVPHPAVTKKVSVLVAADPDSLSGKACTAANYGIPIITEDAFIRIATGMSR